jgi:hypothetical protein
MDGNMAKLSLSKRFEQFVRTLDKFESVDELLQDDDPGKKRADYLLGDRKFIIEQKVLVSNPVSRPQNFVNKLAAERGFVFFGTLSSDYIFSRQPDPELLQRRLVLDLARNIDDIVAKADKQTMETRAIFDIPEAVGVLVILNEGAEQLRPDVIRYALCNSFQKKTTEGTFRYCSNNGVILISEASSVPNPLTPNMPAFPIMPFTSPDKKNSAAVIAFSESLIERWARFNNAPLITMPVDINLKPK